MTHALLINGCTLILLARVFITPFQMGTCSALLRAGQKASEVIEGPQSNEPDTPGVGLAAGKATGPCL